MKRWLIVMTAVLMMLVPSVASAMSEVRLSADDDVKLAELWLDGRMILRVAVAEVIPVWRADDISPTVWLLPCLDGGMLKLIVR